MQFHVTHPSRLPSMQYVALPCCSVFAGAAICTWLLCRTDKPATWVIDFSNQPEDLHRGWGAICSGIAKCRGVLVLNIENNSLTDAHLTKLLHALAGARTVDVKCVLLSGNNFSDIGLEAVADYIGQHHVRATTGSSVCDSPIRVHVDRIICICAGG